LSFETGDLRGTLRFKSQIPNSKFAMLVGLILRMPALAPQPESKHKTLEQQITGFGQPHRGMRRKQLRSAKDGAKVRPIQHSYFLVINLFKPGCRKAGGGRKRRHAH
jgi:hypothetical protein